MKTKPTYGEANDLNLKALIALSRCFQSVRQREMASIRAGGLTLPQFGVLEILYHKGDLRVRDILEGTLSTGGNMTVVIDNLEKEGLVARKPDPEDGRASRICLTEAGRERIAGIFPGHVENIGTIFQVLEPEEKKELVRLLKKVSKKT